MQSIAPSLLTTERLILRQWRESDREPFARLNADPAVMEHFPRCLSRDESDAAVARTQKIIEERGWGFWAVEVPAAAHRSSASSACRYPAFTTHFTPCVEIGWRLAKEHWGHGYASEAAVAACASASRS